MNFANLVSGNIGLIHLIFSIIALTAGTIVLVRKKGSKFHKKIGYIYAVAMMGLLATAFMVYSLYGKFGIFHWLAIVSTLTLMGGMIPMIRKKPANYVSLHWGFMFWSVFGLYAAFAAETLVRIPRIVIESGIPNAVFYNMTGVATAIVMGIACFIMFKKQKDWDKFDKSKT